MSPLQCLLVPDVSAVDEHCAGHDVNLVRDRERERVCECVAKRALPTVVSFHEFAVWPDLAIFMKRYNCADNATPRIWKTGSGCFCGFSLIFSALLIRY